VAAGTTSIVLLRQCGDVHCMYLHHMYLRMGCSLPALVAIPLGPFLSASPSNLVRGPGAGAGQWPPDGMGWDGMGWEGWEGVPRDGFGFESRWDEEAERTGGFILNHRALCLALLVTPSAMIRGSSVLAGANQCFSVSYASSYVDRRQHMCS
jgi:hypothetical protein